MATQNLSTADAILKDLYVGPIVEMLNQNTYLLDQLQRDSSHIDHTGRRAVVPVHKNRNRGRVSGGDGMTLPAAGRQDWTDAIVNIKYHAYGVELSDASIQATANGEGAFISLMEAESKGVARDMKKDVNRQAFGAGNGVLATVSGTPSGTSITVDSVQYVHVGDPVDIVLLSNGQVTNGILSTTVTGRDVTTNTLTISPGTAGALSSSYVVVAASGYSTGTGTATGVNSLGFEMDGLRNLTSATGIVHGINRATAGNEFWKGNVRAVNGVAGESVIEQLYDDCGENGDDVDVFLTTRGVRRRLADTYQSQKRLNDAQMVNVHGGYRGILVNGVPVVADDDAPKGFLFAVNKSVLKWYEQAGPGWLESKDGMIFHLKNASVNAAAKQAIWQAWFRWYAALGINRPNVTGQLTGCTDDGANDNE